MIEKILVPVDGSAHSEKALEFVCDLAKKYNALLYLLHIVESGSGVHEPRSPSSELVDSRMDELEEQGEQLIEEAKSFVKEKGCNAVETVIIGGSPAQHILECAEKHSVDMIVMGSRGLSNLAGLLMGSVSHKVAHLADCTCVTVR